MTLLVGLIAFVAGMATGMSVKQTGDVPRSRLFAAGMFGFTIALSLAILVRTGVVT